MSQAIDTQSNITALAFLIMSEASVGNHAERIAVGCTVLNRMQRNGVARVQDVWNAYAHHQAPIADIVALAEQLLGGVVVDTTHGATHYYSPISMPKEGDATDGFDIGGGLEQVPPLTYRTYRPRWALRYEAENVDGARPAYFKFYREPGDGPVL